MSVSVFDRFLGTAEAIDAFGADAIVQRMLDFEAALARAQAAEGVIPAQAGDAIAAHCKVDRVDVEAIVEASRLAGTLAIPLVKQLTAAVAADDREAAGYVHWGSTSQDVIDTAMALATKRVLAAIDARLGELIGALFALVDRHGDAPILARTLLQPAQVVSFGSKLVAWIAPIVRGRARLRESAHEALQLQLGGAVGTLGVMGEKGRAVAQRMAAELDLTTPEGPWHTQRDTWVRLGCDGAIVCGSLGKIATDIALLAQAEIGEVAEPSGGAGGQRGGSSAMPHKRNPVSSMLAIAAALRTPQRVAALLEAMPQQHERGLGNWQAELAEWPGVFVSLHSSAQALADAASGLEVDEARMRANVDALLGLVAAEGASMLLAREIGKSNAHALLERLSKRTLAEQRPLVELVLEAVESDPALVGRFGTDEIRGVFDVDAAARRASAFARPQLEALRGAAARRDRASDKEMQ